MGLNIVTFNSAFLISHAQSATTQVLIDTWRADIYCVSENHLKSRNNVKFTEYNNIRNDNNAGAALLVRKEYHFEEVVIENLLALAFRSPITVIMSPSERLP